MGAVCLQALAMMELVKILESWTFAGIRGDKIRFVRVT